MLAPALTALLCYFNQVVPVRLDIADGTGVPVPPERDARLAALAGALEAEGFAPLAAVAPGNPEAPGTVYARVLVHAQDAVLAWAIDMARGDLVQSYVELVTEWEHGPAVSTVNHTNPSIFEPLPRLRQVALPGADVATVLARHREACAEVQGMRLDAATRDPLAVAQEQNRETLAHQASVGLLRRRGEDYGFTLRGAWRSTFRLYRAAQRA
jgi:hypothetical protein